MPDTYQLSKDVYPADTIRVTIALPNGSTTTFSHNSNATITETILDGTLTLRPHNGERWHQVIDQEEAADA